MLCRDVVERIECVYPQSAAMGFDNVGLQAGRMDKELHKIYLALDATEDVIQHAIESDVDMLITHHPLIFSPLKAVTDQDFVSRRILKMIQNDISYYAMHTNYDVLGMADLAEQKLHLLDTEVLEETTDIFEKPAGIGRIGRMQKAMSLKECCGFVKESLGLEHVKVFGDMEQIVERMAVSPGSGKSMITPAIMKEAEVLVTGDIGHHEGLDAVEQGLCVIDAGHYGTEYMFIADMAEFLTKAFPELEIKTEPTKMPFQIV